MNNVFVYLEIEGTTVADVSLELLTKGRKLANQLGCQLEAVAAGNNLVGIEKQVLPFGVDKLHVFDAPGLFPYTSLPHSSILINLFKEEKPQICLMGATVIGRDLGPRVSSALTSGLTADCTSLEIGNHEDKKEGKVYENLLYQIRPAFGGNIVATIVNPEHRPQMATVREGVMKKEILDADYKGEVINHDVAKYVPETDYVVKVIDRHVEKAKHNLKGAPIVIAGGYGMGSKEGFDMLFELAKELHAEVGASRAAVDAGYADHDRQIGQTGVTVRPKLYIACGISGQIQHIAGMQESGIIISINNDENAPINTIADYVINGTVEEVIPKMIKYHTVNNNKGNHERADSYICSSFRYIFRYRSRKALVGQELPMDGRLHPGSQVCSCFQDKQEVHQGGRVCFGRTKEGCLAFLRIQKQSPQKDKGRPAYIILCKWQGQPDRSI